MKVLSLFDGISCGMVALERVGINVERYVAYEIEENAIKVSKNNYPQIEHCGNVFDADYALGDTYKKTSSDGSRVLYGYGSKDQTGELFIPPKGYKITPSRFVPNGSYKQKNIIAFKNNKKRKERF